MNLHCWHWSSRYMSVLYSLVAWTVASSWSSKAKPNLTGSVVRFFNSGKQSSCQKQSEPTVLVMKDSLTQNKPLQLQIRSWALIFHLEAPALNMLTKWFLASENVWGLWGVLDWFVIAIFDQYITDYYSILIVNHPDSCLADMFQMFQGSTSFSKTAWKWNGFLRLMRTPITSRQRHIFRIKWVARLPLVKTFDSFRICLQESSI